MDKGSVTGYFLGMNRTLIRKWIENHAPKGREKLAANALISISTLDDVLRGHKPSLEIAERIAGVLGVSLDVIASSPKDDAPPAA